MPEKMSDHAETTFVKEVEIPEATIQLRSDGIVHVHFKMDTLYDMPLQTRMHEIYRELTNGVKSKYIFSGDDGFTFTKEARVNSIFQPKESPVLFYAIVAPNLAYKIIANFYIKMVQQKDNYKMVSSLQDAVDWLHTKA